MNRIIVFLKSLFAAILLITIAGCYDSGTLGDNVKYVLADKIISRSELGFVKAAPESITVEQAEKSKNQTDEKISGAQPNIWSLFDSNTDTAYTADAPFRFTVNFGKTIRLKRIKIYGSTTYRMNIYTSVDESGEIIPELCINKNNLKETWNSLISEDAVAVDSIAVEIIPEGETGIREIEFLSEEKIDLVNGVNASLREIKAYSDLESTINKKVNHILSVAASPDEIALSGKSEESIVSSMRFSLRTNPLSIKRAYLSYNGKNIPTPVSIESRINGREWLGGHDVPEKSGNESKWNELIEEINPQWLLQGENTIEFRTDKPDISIKDLKAVIETDTGWNGVAACSMIEVYDSYADTYEDIKEDKFVELKFDRFIEPEAIIVLLREKSDAKIKIQYLAQGRWIDVKAVWEADLSERDAGWNRIDVPNPVKTTSIRLQFLMPDDNENNTSTIKINEVRVCGSPAGNPFETPKIVVSYPRNGEYFGRTAYIQGFIASDNQANVSVEGKSAQQPAIDNAFTLSLSKDETRFSAQTDDESWDPVLTAIMRDGSISSVMHLTANRLGSSSSVSPGSGSGDGDDTGGGTGGENQGYTTDIYPDSAKTITYGPITIGIPAGAVDEKVTITIIPLTKSEIAPLNPDMTNVTFPAAGYRFLANGKSHYKFKKPILISFTYGKQLLLKGQMDSDVFMYYYDETAGTWKRLLRVNASQQSVSQSFGITSAIVKTSNNAMSSDGLGMLTSETDHFTDIINATITVPEQPDPLLYNPNTIKDIKVGNPSEGIELVDPPSTNNRGDVRLSYPIDVPPGRRGIQPDINVTYNSSHDNGWLGVGWDIPVKAIVIDARWGVPRYTGLEKYSLDGMELEPIGDNVYRTRIEGSFLRIMRKGVGPKEYSWSVTDKNGVKYMYGQSGESRLKSYRDGNIFMWCLERIEDTDGNTIIFKYQFDNVISPNGEQSTEIYPKKIYYTGHNGSEGPYSITFNLDNGNRDDKIITCRSGFKLFKRYRLDSIEVKLGETLIRKYVFTYKRGEFYKSLLQKISQYGEGGELFHEHTFDYYDDIQSENDDTALNGFQSEETIIENLYENSIGMKSGNGIQRKTKFIKVVGKDLNNIKSTVELIDINGDGLLDQVYILDDGIYYRPNRGYNVIDNNENLIFGEPVKIESLSNKINSLGFESNSNSFYYRETGPSGGPHSVVYIDEKNYGTATSKSYFSDVNGDGLDDFVDIGENSSTIYYNSINSSGIPQFSDTRPEGFGSIPDPSEIAIDYVNQDYLNDYYHRDDPILMWQAPFTGKVKVKGDVRLLPRSSIKGGSENYTTADGVNISVQLGKKVLWEKRIKADYTRVIKPLLGFATVNVTAGDQIYFRVNSVDDGAFDCVNWNIIVEYCGVDTSKVDENDMRAYHYESKSDFSNFNSDSSLSLMNGVLHFESKFVKSAITSDDIQVKLIKADSGQNNQEIFAYSVPGSEIGEIEIPFPESLAVQNDQKLVCQLYSDTPVDWTKVSLDCRAIYTQIEGVNTVNDEEGNPLYGYSMPVNISLLPSSEDEYVSPLTIPIGKTGRARIVYSINPFPLNIEMPDDYNARVAIAVKKDGKLVAKEVGSITKGINQTIELDLHLDVKSGDKLDFVCASDKHDFEKYTLVGSPIIYYGSENPSDPNGDISMITGHEIMANVYKARENRHPFSGGFRSWYYGRWNGEIDVLDPDKMKSVNIDENNGNIDENVEEQLKTFSPMGLAVLDVLQENVMEKVWMGMDEDCWIGRVRDPEDSNNNILALSSTRVGKKYINLTSDAGTVIVRNRAVPKTTLYSSGKKQGVFFLNPIHTVPGESATGIDFIDFNGDKYPDIIGNHKVLYTLTDGSLESDFTELDYFEINKNNSTIINKELGNVSRMFFNGIGADGGLDFAINGNSTSNTVQNFVDVNGDSLPDLVNKDDETIKVRYNLGYRLGKEEELNLHGDYQRTKGKSTGWNSAEGGIEGLLVSFFWPKRESETEMQLLDMNNDGLPDKLVKESDRIRIYFNTGNGFIENDNYSWKGSSDDLPLSHETSDGGFKQLKAWAIIECFVIYLYKIESESIDHENVMINDINGDGLPDHIFHDTNNDRSVVWFNKTGRTNLLKQVNRPLGGSFIMDYKREGNTQDMPQSKWVLAAVKAMDGRGNSYDNAYEYHYGYYDRKEREHYGFADIKDTRNDGSSITHYYHNNNFYTKGLEYKTELKDDRDNLYITDEMTYLTRDISGRIKFPYLSEKRTTHHEGNADAGLSTSQIYEYEQHGNIVAFTDNGHEGSPDDVTATITYNTGFPVDSNIVGKPESIIVRGGDGRIYRNRSCTYYSNGNMDTLKQSINGTQAETTFSYDMYGNITRITGPANRNGQRYYREYAYDNVNHSLVTAITDSFGYSSTAEYNYCYGKPLKTHDVNGNSIQYTYDEFGRITNVYGPYDSVEPDNSPAVHLAYSHDVFPAYSHVVNKAYNGSGGIVEVYTYVDGLNRLIKTRKSAEVRGSSLLVSSDTFYNNMGRVEKESYPYTGASPDYLIEYVYDVMGRKINIRYPDGTDVHFDYGFENNYFLTHIVDQAGKEKKNCKDIRGQIRYVREKLKDIWTTTSYQYNPIGEITTIIDDKGNPTNVEYDSLGRRTSIDNKDAGLIEYHYDTAGNLIEKITPNLKSVGKSINYIYEYNRLGRIDYPDMNDVAFTYGDPGAGYNCAGRLKYIDNGTVREERHYGALGEVIKSIRTIRVSVPADQLKSFTTGYSFDSFGRMKTITFPDNEIVHYAYDDGGLLKQVYAGGVDNPRYYVENIDYDEFGHRVEIKYGNGAISRYAYDNETQRLVNLKTALNGKQYQNINYAYDDVGNITERKNNGFVTGDDTGKNAAQTYVYDDLHRLVSSTGTLSTAAGVNKYSNTFTYDTIGNMLTKIQNNTFDPADGGHTTLPATTYAYTYAYGSARPHAVTSTGARSYQYDLNGNMAAVSDAADGFSRSLAWDEENRLTKTIDSGVETDYRYDSGGSRAIKKGGSGETVYVNDNFAVRNNEVISRHVFAGNTRVATAMKAGTADESVYYYHGDHLGSSSVITNNSMQFHEHIEYFPYGETWVQGKASTSQESMPYKFTSKEQDTETGLYYFGARYYEPKISRWISTDPAVEKYLPGAGKGSDGLPGEGGVFNPTNLNVYHYGLNNPLKYIDPDGNDAVAIVFPDYKINASGTRLPFLGHAGILLIDNRTGATRYYEYGRYDPQQLGVVKKVPVSNVVMDQKTKMPTEKSLQKVLSQISNISGQQGKIEGAYIKNDNYSDMVKYAEGRYYEGLNNPNREPYSIWTNNCGHFMQSVLESGGVYTPFYIDPRPNSYIDEIQNMNLFFWNNYINIEYNSSGSGGGQTYFGVHFGF